MVISAENLSDEIAEGLGKTYPEVKLRDRELEVTAKEISFEEITDYLRSQGVVIRSASLKQPSLDDVFLRLTGKELRE
jgi:ABC-2 type transport system ATP-binding protein